LKRKTWGIKMGRLLKLDQSIDQPVQSTQDFDQWIIDRCQQIKKQFEEWKWVYIGEGNNRIALKYRNIVVKIPKNPNGIDDNYSKPCMKYAPKSKIIELPKTGIPLLFMEYLNPNVKEKLPQWTLSYDCQQVGYDRKGNLKLYDW